jgi:hypothetical protein
MLFLQCFQAIQGDGFTGDGGRAQGGVAPAERRPVEVPDTRQKSFVHIHMCLRACPPDSKEIVTRLVHPCAGTEGLHSFALCAIGFEMNV